MWAGTATVMARRRHDAGPAKVGLPEAVQLGGRMRTCPTCGGRLCESALEGVPQCEDCGWYSSHALAQTGLSHETGSLLMQRLHEKRAPSEVIVKAPAKGCGCIFLAILLVLGIIVFKMIEGQ